MKIPIITLLAPALGLSQMTVINTVTIPNSDRRNTAWPPCEPSTVTATLIHRADIVTTTETKTVSQAIATTETETVSQSGATPEPIFPKDEPPHSCDGKLSSPAGDFSQATVSLCANADFDKCFLKDFVASPNICYPIPFNEFTSINFEGRIWCKLSTGKYCEGNDSKDYLAITIKSPQKNIASLDKVEAPNFESWNDRIRSFKCWRLG